MAVSYTTIDREIRKEARKLTEIERRYVDDLAESLRQFKFKGAEHTRTRRFFVRKVMTVGIQNIHTPFALCHEMIGKLSAYTTITGKRIAVLFNIEFLEVLIYDFGVDPANIYFFADSKPEFIAAVKLYGLKEETNVFLLDVMASKEQKEIVTHRGVCKMKFDVVAGNPPYQPPQNNGTGGGDGSRNTIWDKFVPLCLELTNQNGFICLVHPAKWRKPEDELWPLFQSRNLKYVELHSDRDGLRTFGATTRYDWYVLQNSPNEYKTTVKDERGENGVVNIADWPFLPNFSLEKVHALLAKDGEEKSTVLFSRRLHGTDSPWMSEKQSEIHKYKCVHWTGKSEPYRKFWYSSKQSELLQTPKLIFAESRFIANAIVDYRGEYGITQGAIGIAIRSKEEGEEMKLALESEAFNEVLKSCRWSNFRIDWRMFRHFRRDFWREFLPK